MPLNLICDKEASFQKMEMQVSLQVQIRQIPASTSYWSTRRFLWFIIYSQQAGDGERASPWTSDSLECQGSVMVSLTRDKELQITSALNTEKAKDQ